MLNFRKNFYTFNARQVGAAQALAELDGGMTGCVPYIVGDTVAVFMHTYNGRCRKELEDKGDKFVKDTMKKYNVKYKKVCFKD